MRVKGDYFVLITSYHCQRYNWKFCEKRLYTKFNFESL